MRSSLNALVFLSFLSFYCLSHLAQAAGPVVRFEQLSIDHGLSQNTVTAIVQDRQGFIWVGTRDGLNRYDGYQFKVFRRDPQTPGSISDNYIWSIFEDSLGNLWVGTGAGGLNRYDARSETFHHFRHQPNVANSLSDDGVRTIYEDSSGTLWIGTDAGGLNKFDRQNQNFFHLRHQANKPDSLSHDRVYSITEDAKGALWVGTAKGLNYYDKTLQAFKHFRHDWAVSDSLSHDRVRAVFVDSKGLLWVATEGGGVNLYDDKTQGFTHFKRDAANPDSLSNDAVITIAQGDDDTLWFGTWGGGLNQYDANSQRFTRLRDSAADAFSISSDLIYTLYKDNRGMLWVGTSGGGINLYDPQSRHFGHFAHDDADPASLSESNVRSILKDSKGVVWVGTRGSGLNRYDALTGRFVHFRHDKTDPDSLGDGQVYSLFEDSKARLWVGTSDGLNLFQPKSDDPQQGSFKHFRHNSADLGSLSDNRVKAMAEGEHGILWIATSGGGVNQFNPETGVFKAFVHEPSDLNSLSDGSVMSLLTVGQSSANWGLWLGTLGGGLNRYDPSSGGFVRYRHQQDDPNSLSHDRVFALHQDAKGTLWVGTAGGLNKFNATEQQFKHYRENDGLANDVVLGILEDRQGLLWISSNKGLSRFDPVSEKFTTYDSKNGLQSNEFNLAARHQGSDGEMFFGGINGFNRFYPEQIKPDTRLPVVTLTDFLLSNNSASIRSVAAGGFTLSKAINQLQEIQLTYQQRLVSFEFSGLDFANPMKTQYAYRLEGWDEDWIYTDGKVRRATYTKLDAGDYVFKVKAANQDGLWNETAKSTKITVLSPWWESWPVYLLVTMVLFWLVYGVYRYRTRALVAKAAELEQHVLQRTQTINQLMAQKQQMFTNVSHEFKTPLTLILNPLESISPHLEIGEFERKVSMMKRNGQRLLHMVEQLLELSKLESSATDQRYFYSLSDTINRLLVSFQPLFDSKNLSLKLSPKSPSFKDVVLHLTVDSLEMIISNLLSNAIKYTPVNGEISVTVSATDKAVVIVVQDNGIGISDDNQKIVFNRFTRAAENTSNSANGESVPGAGIGLALVKDLVEANQGTITLSSEVNCGSTFTVTLPLSEEQDVAVEKVSGLSTASMIEADAVGETKSSGKAATLAGSDVEKGFEGESEDHGKPNLLLIDDNPDMLELLVDTLSEKYHCTTAHNGEQGLYQATENLPDLVISDVMMPGISGFEVLEHLKLNELTNHIPVVLLTAKGDVQSRIKGWASNADEYLEKPFNGEELKSRIANLLSIRALLRYRFQRTFIAEPASVAEPKLVSSPEEIVAAVVEAEVAKTAEAPILQASDDDNTINRVNQTFLDNVNAVLEKHYSDETLDVALLAKELAMSQRQLTRKMRSLLDFTPSESIRSFRLKKAVSLLNDGVLPSAVAHQVGFTSHSYFSRCFKAQYDCMPSSFRS
ncbi:MAG: signal transduction histidine kinase/ligand-binding sensor domain-containing protein [Phenylobacterium sp.]|jgi:signal transduction histidine kinase/ligand-binding sensor domain-containing protein/DNA-binding response OmpR family regulator